MNASNQTNFAGNVLTVNGLVGPEDVGVAIMHEHIILDISYDPVPGHNAPATDLDLWQQKLSLENLHSAREGKLVKDNFMLTDESLL